MLKSSTTYNVPNSLDQLKNTDHVKRVKTYLFRFSYILNNNTNASSDWMLM